MSKALFVTGTGTDTGKTYVTGLIVKKLQEAKKNPAYYKAAMSGNDRRPDGTLIPGDALAVQTMSGIDQSLTSMCPYVYEHAYSPHLASRLEGNPVVMDVVTHGFADVTAVYDYVTVEGSGGILCPICFDEARIQLEDVVKELHLSSILIADARTWHHQQRSTDRRIHENPRIAAERNYFQSLPSGRCDGGRQYFHVRTYDRTADTGKGAGR